MLYVELDADGTARHFSYAPYLDYRPLTDESRTSSESSSDRSAAGSLANWSTTAQGYAVANVVPEHLAEVRDGRSSR